jgi:hypothetical protein
MVWVLSRGWNPQAPQRYYYNVTKGTFLCSIMSRGTISAQLTILLLFSSYLDFDVLGVYCGLDRSRRIPSRI